MMDLSENKGVENKGVVTAVKETETFARELCSRGVLWGKWGEVQL